MTVDDSYTKILLHFNGGDASTTFTDESGKTWTGYGNAQLDTAYKKFGSASLVLDGTGDYIDTPDSSDFTLGSGDFTFDCWCKLNAFGTRRTIFGQTNGTSANHTISLEFTADNIIRCITRDSSNENYTLVGITAITDSNWHHIALVRNGSDLIVYLDGIQDGKISIGTATIFNTSLVFVVGKYGTYGGGLYFNGHIDEFRFSKGIARWTSDFTPPSCEYAYLNLRTINGINLQSVKTINGVSINSIKSVWGI